MKMDLEVFGSFKASHSLAGFETPHFHLWKMSVCFTSDFPMKEDRILDLVFLQNTIQEITRPIQGCYLNTTLAFSPTSENMTAWLWDRVTAVLPDAPLKSIQITLCSLDGEAMGSATLHK